MTHTLEVLNPSGHLTLSWTPDDPASRERAEQEFERLKVDGYAFFATPESSVKVTRLKDGVWAQPGSLDVRPEQVKAFRPSARRAEARRQRAQGAAA